MRTIEFSTQFKKDFKREQKGQYRQTVRDDLQTVLDLLTVDAPLPVAYKDHALVGTGKLKKRDLHIHPDLVLIYSTATDGVLKLYRLGSHAELF